MSPLTQARGTVASDELPITGYVDRFSHRPGETFAAHVSVRDGTPFRVRLQRVVCADPNPAGPGMRLEDLSAVLDRTVQGARHPVRLGSHGIVDPAPACPEGARSLSALVCPGVVDRAQAVIAQQDGGARLTLALGPGGAQAALAWDGGAVAVETGAALRKGRWYRIWLSADPATGRVLVGQAALAGGAAVTAQAEAPGIRLPAGGTLMLAASNPDAPAQHLTGKLEAPAIHAGWAEAPPAGNAVAAWDFSIGIGTQAITDTGKQARHGLLVNRPTRAVVGAFWTGREMCWRHAPEDYAAIHFHDDDIDDCGWPESFAWTVPDDLPSGAYALHLSCEAGEDWLPLYVLPRRAGPFAPVAFLASTFTYQAYANHARGNADAAYKARAAEWGAYPHNPDDYPLYGRSTYNRHRDNSGIAFSSRRRPVLTMRPGFLTFNDARGSGLRHYPADTHLLAWLEAKGIAFDIVTDEDLDDEGPALLAPYRCVLTGSHPEYHTPGTLDALAAYTGSGGRLCYLGGNGFYWRIARDKAAPHMIELRRAEGGIRAWAAEPGEYYHQTDGQYGGLWRRNRRPPQMLAGVGFSGQGLFEGTHYRVLPGARESRFGWMLDGIADDTIGDYGLSGGGAAGFELDRADPALGTPDGTVILARSEDAPSSFVTVPEELLSHIATVTGEPVADLMRGEIVAFDTPSGGAVFAVGSITFCGSLWRDGRAEGPVSRLLENVVRRFAAAPRGEA
ncbi:MAG: N,N-dimethylformamidase large subunit [Proteobacteria bacterium]|nr:N,N-dimethylformamidase large subunit [Pseudomonadota bacterium]